MDSKPIVGAELLRQTYGSLDAVDDVNLEVFEGEIFGMVGPNRAGKTTTIECLEGLREINGGRIRAMGLDPVADKYRIPPRIGLSSNKVPFPHTFGFTKRCCSRSSCPRRPSDGNDRRL